MECGACPQLETHCAVLDGLDARKNDSKAKQLPLLQVLCNLDIVLNWLHNQSIRQTSQRNALAIASDGSIAEPRRPIPPVPLADLLANALHLLELPLLGLLSLDLPTVATRLGEALLHLEI